MPGLVIWSRATFFGFAFVPTIPCGPMGAAASENAERNRVTVFIELLRWTPAPAVATHTDELPTPSNMGAAGYLNWTGRGLFLPTATAWTAAARGTVGLGAGFALVSAATASEVDGGSRFAPCRHEHASRSDDE